MVNYSRWITYKCVVRKVHRRWRIQYLRHFLRRPHPFSCVYILENRLVLTTIRSTDETPTRRCRYNRFAVLYRFLFFLLFLTSCLITLSSGKFIRYWFRNGNYNLSGVRRLHWFMECKIICVRQLKWNVLPSAVVRTSVTNPTETCFTYAYVANWKCLLLKY